MKSWLRFFGLSFFSDKIAKEARIRGVLNCVLGFVFALVFIFCGVLASNTVPFYTHYKNASEFRSFVYNFTENADLTVKDGLVSSPNVIDTIAEEGDAAKYSVNGYNLIVDTRSSSALCRFEAYCTPKNGGVDEITYEEYLALTDEAKGNYQFNIRYTTEELILDEKLIADCEEYLNAVEDTDTAKKFAEIKENKQNVTAEEYNKSVYALCVHTYYPEMINFEREGEAPLLRTFYFANYLNGTVTEKCLFIFDNVLCCYYDTDGGLSVIFYGAFTKNTQGAVTAENADMFIKEAFQSAVPLSVNVYLLNIFRFIPFIAAIPLILALVAKIGFSLLKNEKYKKYTTCLKIEFSYLAWAAIFTAVIMFILGFLISGTVLNVLPLAVFAGVMLVRTAVLLAGEYISKKKAPPVQPVEGEETSAETDAETR